jgi:drug/metabolite transporter (DMT)-like permease
MVTAPPGSAPSRATMTAGVLMVTCAAASWGTWSLFLRPTGLSAWVISPIMFAIMAVVAFPLTLREPPAHWDRRTVWLLAGNTISDAVNVITFFAALQYTTVAIAVLTHYLAPIFIALAAPRVEGTHTRGARAAAAIALAGLVIVLEPWRDAADGVLIGAVLGAVSAVAYMCNVFVVRRLAERIGPARVMSYHSALAAVVMLPFAVSGLATVSWTDFALLAAGSTTVGALSGVVFIAGLGRIGAARSAVLTFAEPLVAVSVGALVWDEPMRPLAAVGGALILAAGIGVARQGR